MRRRAFSAFAAPVRVVGELREASAWRAARRAWCLAVARRRCECEREAMDDGLLARVLGSVQASLEEKKAELATKNAELQAAAVETARLMARLSALEAGSGPAAGRELAGAEGAAGGDATALEAPGGRSRTRPRVLLRR